MSSSPVQPQIHHAVDGEEITSQRQASVYRRRLFRPYYPFTLLQGEIGAFLSHRSCWKRIWQGDSDAGLVLEDDAILDPELMQFAFRLACTRISELGHIQFAARKPRGSASILQSEIFEAETLVKLAAFRRVPLGMVAQLISSSAARQLYHATEAFDRPVDTFLQMHWLTGQPIATVFPSGVKIDSSGVTVKSTIHRREVRRNWWSREWRRFRYRDAIRRRSRNHLEALRRL